LTHPSDRLVVVVSALKGVTDQLEEAYSCALQGDSRSDRLRIRHRSVCHQLGLPPDLLDRLWRELQALLIKIGTPEGGAQVGSKAAHDQVLSFGERASARIVAATLRAVGAPATPVDAFDLGLKTIDEAGVSRLAPKTMAAIGPGLAAVPGIPVVTGFLAQNSEGQLTTLGRDGSDWTAAILASALRAEALVYWKDVGGVMSADPRKIPQAHTLERLTREEACELAFQGSQVLHAGAVESGLTDATQVWVRGVESREGTRLVGHPSQTDHGPRAVASHERLIGVCYQAPSQLRRQALQAAALVALGRHGKVARLTQVSGQQVWLWFEQDQDEAQVLSALPPWDQLCVDFASIALIGQGIGTNYEQFQYALAELLRSGIRIHHAQLSWREHALVFLVERVQQTQALSCLYDACIANRPEASTPGNL